MNYTFVDTPIGALLVAGTAAAVHEIHFAGATPKNDWTRDDAALAGAAAQLRAYFAGALLQFDLTLAFAGTEFQKSVWNHLRAIPYGETTTYAAIARAIGRPDAVRAVGAANGANPIPVVVPCHRVIGSNGALTGFGGGIEVKRWLLDHEERVAGRRLF
ncbi:MAG: methylated-DNA--[protein]-cysteine S-methyltransferase [Acidobacteriota bacterium]